MTSLQYDMINENQTNDDVTSTQKSDEYEMYDHLKDTLNEISFRL